MKSPTHYLAENIDVLVSKVPGIRDGDPEAIHDARVATRRIREALPIVRAAGAHIDLDPVEVTARKAGRALGRTRDVGVALDLVQDIERRAPQIAASVSALRCDLLWELAAAQRRLVKKIDALPLDEVRVIGERLRARAWWANRTSTVRRRVRRELLHAVRAQAGSLRALIVHGSGVYFPRRAHATRIDLKKLRYVLEIAQRPRSASVRGLELLKKTQSLLGELHDREFLRERLERVQNPEPKEGRHDSSLPILLQAECATLYADYLRRRSSLLALCAELERSGERAWSTPLGVGGALVGAGAVATTAWLLSARPNRATPRTEGTVRRAS
jgi:CHAD domain-containing protein